jgi:hypothetical protein
MLHCGPRLGFTCRRSSVCIYIYVIDNIYIYIHIKSSSISIWVQTHMYVLYTCKCMHTHSRARVNTIIQAFGVVALVHANAFIHTYMMDVY